MQYHHLNGICMVYAWYILGIVQLYVVLIHRIVTIIFSKFARISPFSPLAPFSREFTPLSIYHDNFLHFESAAFFAPKS